MQQAENGDFSYGICSIQAKALLRGPCVSFILYDIFLENFFKKPHFFLYLWATIIRIITVLMIAISYH